MSLTAFNNLKCIKKSSIQTLRQDKSCADLFQLSGIIAVRVAGGPFINFTPGGLLILTRSAPLLNAGPYLYIHWMVYLEYRQKRFQSSSPTRAIAII